MLSCLSKTQELDSEPPGTSRNTASDEDSDSDEGGFQETDESRRKLLVDAGAGWRFASNLKLESDVEFDANDTIDLVSEDEAPSARDGAPATPRSGPNPSLPTVAGTKPEKGRSGLVEMVRSEVDLRNRERLGLVGERRLGGAFSGKAKSRLLSLAIQPDKRETREHADSGDKAASSSSTLRSDNATTSSEWACLVCTWYVCSRTLTQPLH